MTTTDNPLNMIVRLSMALEVLYKRKDKSFSLNCIKSHLFYISRQNKYLEMRGQRTNKIILEVLQTIHLWLPEINYHRAIIFASIVGPHIFSRIYTHSSRSGKENNEVVNHTSERLGFWQAPGCPRQFDASKYKFKRIIFWPSLYRLFD